MRTYEGLGLTGPTVPTRAAVSTLIDEWEATPDTVLRPSHGEWAAACLDGRPVRWGEDERHYPRLAGGIVSALAGVLMSGVWGDDTGCAAQEQAARRIGALAAEAGWPVLFHIDELAGQRRSGCGAADGWSLALSLLGRGEPAVVSFLDALGLHVPDAQWCERARTLAADPPTGPQLREAIVASASEPESLMLGVHAEVATLVTTTRGWTVRREVVEEQLRARGIDQPQVFVCDLWAAHAMGEALGERLGVDPQALGAAIASYSVAALVVLGGESMPWGCLARSDT